ncbi:hypothetical protein HDV00_009002 [Rhizophlyctis rosea]|nr:hypothetical protein HDV00_009002 [Rhizophlyctis rosea]
MTELQRRAPHKNTTILHETCFIKETTGYPADEQETLTFQFLFGQTHLSLLEAYFPGVRFESLQTWYDAITAPSRSRAPRPLFVGTAQDSIRKPSGPVVRYRAVKKPAKIVADDVATCVKERFKEKRKAVGAASPTGGVSGVLVDVPFLVCVDPLSYEAVTATFPAADDPNAVRCTVTSLASLASPTSFNAPRTTSSAPQPSPSDPAFILKTQKRRIKALLFATSQLLDIPPCTNAGFKSCAFMPYNTAAQLDANAMFVCPVCLGALRNAVGDFNFVERYKRIEKWLVEQGKGWTEELGWLKNVRQNVEKFTGIAKSATPKPAITVPTRPSIAWGNGMSAAASAAEGNGSTEQNGCGSSVGSGSEPNTTFMDVFLNTPPVSPPCITETSGTPTPHPDLKRKRSSTNAQRTTHHKQPFHHDGPQMSPNGTDMDLTPDEPLYNELSAKQAAKAIMHVVNGWAGNVRRDRSKEERMDHAMHILARVGELVTAAVESGEDGGRLESGNGRML